ncbi:unnamed protein product [Camellia sinensis]
MGSIGGVNKPHAVCLLHLRGFHITFVNTEYNHNRLLRSTGPNSLDGLPDFRFETIPDGLPPSDADSTQDIPSLCDSTSKNCLVPSSNLIFKLNDASSPSDVPPVTCIVSDGCMSFTLDAAEEFGVPEVLFWTPGACGVLGYSYCKHLVERDLVPLKDGSFLTNGYLDTTIDWIPRMNNIRLKDLPTFIRTTGNDPNHFMLNFLIRETDRTNRASAIVINTFHALERAVVDSLSPTCIPPVYTIGPLHLMLNNQISADDKSNSIGSNLWKEDPECIDWLNSQQPNSVVYVNIGSITVMTAQQLTEFAWGLAKSEKNFLWTIRPDIVSGDTTILPPKFVAETKDRRQAGENYANPQICFFHVLFKAAALAFYILSALFVDSFVIIFVVTVLLAALDFWVVKNVSGRILVGLRWWNEITDEGESVWKFECLDQEENSEWNDWQTTVLQERNIVENVYRWACGF